MKKFLAVLFLLLLLAGTASAQIKLIQSTAIDVAVGPFLSSTDGVTAMTLSITQTDVRLKKNGGAWAQKNQASTCAQEENGWQECSLNATDTDTLGILVLSVTKATAVPVWIYFEVIPSSSHALLVGGNVASNSDFWNTATASITAGIGLQIKTNLDIPVSQAGGLITRGIAQGGAPNTITLEATAPAISLVNKRIILTNGTGAFQSGIITAYNTGTKVATVQDSSTSGNWGTPPISGTTYIIFDASIGNLVDSDIEIGTSGTAQAGAATSITLAATSSGTANFYKDKRILLTGGTGAGQSAIISAYNQTSKVATIFCEGSATGAWFTNPDSTTQYLIVARNKQ